MHARYQKNMNMLSAEENENLATRRICVVGCGGLGGYIVEFLGRLGVGHITAIDGDVFDESNLNRQLLSDVKTLGKSKAQQAVDRMAIVNPLIEVLAITQRVTSENGLKLLADCDAIVDATDTISSRLELQEMAKELNTPLVHGAIAGWYGQVSTIFPGDDTLNLLYPAASQNSGLETELGNPSFTPALVASIQVSEVLKILIKRGDLLRKKVLYIDLLSQDYTVVSL